MAQVKIYTDGSCLINPGGNGGWAAILVMDEHEKEIAGGVRGTTNNRMELWAAIEGLRALKRPCSDVLIVTDSEYLKLGINARMAAWEAKGWHTSTGSKVKNQDLWEQLSELRRTHHVRAVWTQGHKKHVYNERCDKAAGAAARACNDSTPIDPGGSMPKTQAESPSWDDAYAAMG